MRTAKEAAEKPMPGDRWQNYNYEIEVHRLDARRVYFLVHSRFRKSPIYAVPMSCNSTHEGFVKDLYGFDFLGGAR